jgi:hypothetical protein
MAMQVLPASGSVSSSAAIRLERLAISSSTALK